MMYKLRNVLKNSLKLLLVVVLMNNSNLSCFAIQDLDSLQGGATITLEDCIEYAFANSPVIKKAKNNVLAPP